MAFLCVLVGYLIGGLNPSFLIGYLKGVDVRHTGSGNAGASNAAMLLGRGIGFFCMCFDIFKAYLACRLSMVLFPSVAYNWLLGGTACLLGHVYPVALGFKGGKGLACLVGLVLAYDYGVFLVMLVLSISLILIADYIFLVALCGSFVFGGVLFVREGASAVMIFLPVMVMMLIKHRDNIARLRYGVEIRVSYLWNKDEEEKRFRANWRKLSDDVRKQLNLETLPR